MQEQSLSANSPERYGERKIYQDCASNRAADFQQSLKTREYFGHKVIGPRSRQICERPRGSETTLPLLISSSLLDSSSNYYLFNNLDIFLDSGPCGVLSSTQARAGRADSPQSLILSKSSVRQRIREISQHRNAKKLRQMSCLHPSLFKSIPITITFKCLH
jgi:hypothetical protein